MAKPDIQPMINAIQTLTKTPLCKFDGVSWGTVSSTSPEIKIKTTEVELPESMLELSPFCVEWKTTIFKHTHKYDDNDTMGTTQTNIDTSEELKEVVMWNGLKVGDKVLMLRTNESQKYIVLWKKGQFNGLS